MCFELVVSLCACEEEEKAIVEARVGVQALDLSFSEVGAPLGGKKLKAFFIILDLYFMDQFLGFLSQDRDFMCK